MEELMHSKAAVMAVLHYLFARFDERFDGAPTLLILDEAWLFSMTRCLRRTSASGSRRSGRRTSASSLPRRAWRTSRIRASRRPSSSCASRIFRPTAGDRAADSHDLRRLAQQPPDRDRGDCTAQAGLLLPVASRQSPVRPRPGRRDLGLRGCVHAARPARSTRCSLPPPPPHLPLPPRSRPPGCAIAACIGPPNCCPRFSPPAGELTMKTRILPPQSPPS